MLRRLIFATIATLFATPLCAAQTTYGTGCNSGLVYVNQPKVSNHPSRPFMSWAWSNYANRPAIHTMGFRLPTPIPTWPGCHLYVSMLVCTPGVTDGSGTWFIPWTFTPAMIGIRVDEQFHIYDDVFNSWLSTNGGTWTVQR